MNWMTVLIVYTFETNLLAAADIEDCRRIAQKLPLYDEDYVLPNVSTESWMSHIYKVFQIAIYNFKEIIVYQIYAKNNVWKSNR